MILESELIIGGFREPKPAANVLSNILRTLKLSLPANISNRFNLQLAKQIARQASELLRKDTLEAELNLIAGVTVKVT